MSRGLRATRFATFLRVNVFAEGLKRATGLPSFGGSRAAARQIARLGRGSSEASDKDGDGAGDEVALAGLAVPAYANAPAVHFVEDVTGDTLVCESTTYTITSGSIKIVTHEGEAASGNANFTVTLTPQHVVAEDLAGNVYSLRGAFWFGGAFNAQQGHGGVHGHRQAPGCEPRLRDCRQRERDVPRHRRQRQCEGLRLRDLRGARGRGVATAASNGRVRDPFGLVVNGLSWGGLGGDDGEHTEGRTRGRRARRRGSGR